MPLYLGGDGSVLGQYRRTYVINALTMSVYWEKINYVENPCQTNCFIEQGPTHNDTDSYPPRIDYAWHSEGVNVAYFDGHVGWKKLSEIPASMSDVFWNQAF